MAGTKQTTRKQLEEDHLVTWKKSTRRDPTSQLHGRGLKQSQRQERF